MKACIWWTCSHSITCMQVEGATRDERCRERLKLAKALIEDSETAESMMMEHRKDQAGRLLSVLSQERSAIRPRDWQGRAICENYWHTKIQALSTRQVGVPPLTLAPVPKCLDVQRLPALFGLLGTPMKHFCGLLDRASQCPTCIPLAWLASSESPSEPN